MGEMMQECLVKWRLSGHDQPAILCSPPETAAMLMGLLLTSGKIRHAHDVQSMTMHNGCWNVEAHLQDMPASLDERMERLPACQSAKTLSLSQADALSLAMMSREHGPGLHSVMLTTQRQQIICCDIGRHNALDKAVGTLALTGDNPADAIMCTSGRISVEIIAKAAAAGIPVLCTRKAVGNLAAALGEKYAIALVQLGKQPMVYGAAWRVTGT